MIVYVLKRGVIMYEQKYIEKKIRNLKHQLEYLKKVYPGCDKIIKLKNQISYYNNKLASLCD
jgi:hypothetical protein